MSKKHAFKVVVTDDRPSAIVGCDVMSAITKSRTRLTDTLRAPEIHGLPEVDAERELLRKERDEVVEYARGLEAKIAGLAAAIHELATQHQSDEDDVVLRGDLNVIATLALELSETASVREDEEVRKAKLDWKKLGDRVLEDAAHMEELKKAVFEDEDAGMSRHAQIWLFHDHVEISLEEQKTLAHGGHTEDSIANGEGWTLAEAVKGLKLECLEADLKVIREAAAAHETKKTKRKKGK